MASIMQGTTPSLTITIDTDDLLLSAVTAMELYIRNGNKTTTYAMGDLTVDTEANTITKTFTEAETAALDPERNMIVQGRFWIGSSVVGMNKISFDVSDMLGVGKDG